MAKVAPRAGNFGHLIKVLLHSALIDELSKNCSRSPNSCLPQILSPKKHMLAKLLPFYLYNYVKSGTKLPRMTVLAVENGDKLNKCYFQFYKTLILLILILLLLLLLLIIIIIL